jgi:D-alanine transaminase
MAKISYVNGRYLQHPDAMVHMEDRGYQFSDGIYEVIAFYNRRLLDEDLHMKRLIRSLKELHIALPMSDKALRLVMGELIARNDRVDGTIYLQISRGVSKRDHPFPKENIKPALTMAITGAKMPKAKEVKDGVSVITHPEQRWARRDIKSISLLPNILAKQAATAAGVREAWLVDEKGIISEGAVSNNAIVSAKGEIITHPATEFILGGITRDVALRLARDAGIKVIERPFSLKEAKAAKEAFLTSTTANILPVTKLDNTTIGNGKPGPVTLKLLNLYYDHIYNQTGKKWN